MRIHYIAKLWTQQPRRRRSVSSEAREHRSLIEDIDFICAHFVWCIRIYCGKNLQKKWRWLANMHARAHLCWLSTIVTESHWKTRTCCACAIAFVEACEHNLWPGPDWLVNLFQIHKLCACLCVSVWWQYRAVTNVCARLAIHLCTIRLNTMWF